MEIKEKLPPSKNILLKPIFHLGKDGQYADFYFGELPKDLLIDDVINIIREDSYCSENNSYDAYSELVAYRHVEETDEEFNQRIKRENEAKQEREKREYELYIKLKNKYEKITHE